MKKYSLVGFKNREFTLTEIRKLVKDGKYMPPDKKVLSAIKGRKILDLGCNIGNYSHVLAKRDAQARIIGVDYADDLIEIAGDLYKDIPNVSFRLMEAAHLQFDDNEFDSAILLEVIEHLYDPISALKEIYRVLKPQGELILSTNNVFYIRFLLRQCIYDILRKAPKLMIHQPGIKWGAHIFAWDLSTLCTLLKVVGFRYRSHFYTGSSGFFIGNTVLDKYIDNIFAMSLPSLRATVAVKFYKESS